MPNPQKLAEGILTCMKNMVSGHADFMRMMEKEANSIAAMPAFKAKA